MTIGDALGHAIILEPESYTEVESLGYRESVCGLFAKMAAIYSAGREMGREDFTARSRTWRKLKGHAKRPYVHDFLIILKLIGVLPGARPYHPQRR